MDKQKAKTNISIKGTKDGLIIYTNGENWKSVRASIITILKDQKEFLKGAHLAVDVGNITIKTAEMVKFREEINKMDMVLKAIISTSPTTERNAQGLGLETRIAKPVAGRDYNYSSSNIFGEEAMLIHKTLRSGNRVQFAGHVIVIGDVNPGAEIFAGGNIIVWGKLRGTVHAGAQGDKSAIVCALDLSPTQLRIADKISIAPKQKRKPKPEIARLIDDKVVAESWKY